MAGYTAAIISALGTDGHVALFSPEVKTRRRNQNRIHNAAHHARVRVTTSYDDADKCVHGFLIEEGR